MLGLGNKTAISLLQEYMVAQKKIPSYELVHQRVGTHNPEFAFKVVVGDQFEIGIGSSKKEAKHRAAEKMLIKLKVIKEKQDGENSEQEETDTTAKPNENYVGQLKDLCILLKYPEPKYNLEEAAGPAHDRVFKIICCVSQLQDFGIAKTVKQAKHNAAFRMLQHLKEVGGDKVLEVLSQNESPSKVLYNKSKVSDEEIISKYNAIRSTTGINTASQSVFYKDHHKAFESLPESSSTLSDVIKNNQLSIDSAVNIVQQIANELEVNLEIDEADASEKNFILMSMSVFPSIAGIGFKKSEAAFNLLKSLVYLASDQVLSLS